MSPSLVSLFRAISGVVAISGILVACGDGTSEPPTPVATSLTVSPAEATLTALGASTQLSASVRDQSGNPMPGASVSWTSGNAAVASVGSNGLTTAVSVGSTTVTATSGSASGAATVTVSQVVTAVSVSPASHTVRLGEGNVQFTAAVKDANGHAVQGAAVSWSSSNPQCARVDAGTGLATPVTPGAVTITATSGTVSGTASLTVLPPPVATVEVTPSTGSTLVGGTLQLTATTRDASGTILTGRSITWISENPSIASVDGSGLVTGLAVGGPVTITATSEGKSGTASVTVESPTRLYLRHIDGKPLLSTDPMTSGSVRVTLYGSGGAYEFKAILGKAISGTGYGFSIWFGAGNSSGQIGTWTAAVLVERGGVRTTLATHAFQVPFNSQYVQYNGNVTGVPGGAPGDQIILRLTITGVSVGGVLFAPAPHDSHLIVPGAVTVSPLTASEMVSPVEGGGVTVEATDVPDVRYKGGSGNR